MTTAIGGGGARRFDFGDDEDNPPKFEDKEAPSAEMRALLNDRAKKQENRRKRPKTIAAAQFGRARVEVEAMIDTDNWDGVTARHLVALFDVMHTEVYGVEPGELGPAERFNASMMAANLTKREFGGDFKKTVEFMRWAWGREAESEQWRRENGRTNGRRIGARLMFSGSLVTDYRVYLARARPRL